MPTTGAVMYLLPTMPLSAGSGRNTGAVMQFALRDSTAQFTSGAGIAASASLRNKRAMLPSRSVPVIDPSGMMTQNWWDYFSFINGTFLRARIGPTMLDLQNSILTIQAHSGSSESSLASVTQQLSAVAQSVQALRDVAVAAATPGATSVPVPPTAPQVTPSGNEPAPGGPGGGDGGGSGD